MTDNGHGPDHKSSVQKLSGFAFNDFDHSQDLIDFLYPRRPGTSLLALGSFGAAFGKTRTSYTGTVIERALHNAPPYGVLFLDILNVLAPPGHGWTPWIKYELFWKKDLKMT
jgi:hypothetical protein